MSSPEWRDLRSQTYLLTPAPALQFEKQRVTPARLQARIDIENEQLSHFELDLLLKTPAQVHAFQGFLSQFQPVEAIQALAYFPDAELHVIFSARPALLDWLRQAGHTAPRVADFLNAAEVSPLGDLDQFYSFQQYESVPV